jgi:hypothetical protein
MGLMVLIAAAAEFAFVARFVRIPWWRTPEGRMIMAKDTVLSLVLMLAFIRVFAPDLPNITVIRDVTWTLIAAVFVWKVTLFYRRQAEGRRERREMMHAEEER